jgi:hypothetical protein
MGNVNKIIVSDCCETQIHFIPPSTKCGPTYFCSSCGNFCVTKLVEDKTHGESQKR